MSTTFDDLYKNFLNKSKIARMAHSGYVARLEEFTDQYRKDNPETIKSLENIAAGWDDEAKFYLEAARRIQRSIT